MTSLIEDVSCLSASLMDFSPSPDHLMPQRIRAGVEILAPIVHGPCTGDADLPASRWNPIDNPPAPAGSFNPGKVADDHLLYTYGTFSGLWDGLKDRQLPGERWNDTVSVIHTVDGVRSAKTRRRTTARVVQLRRSPSSNVNHAVPICVPTAAYRLTALQP